MVKHTQTIRQQQPTNCLFDHFVWLALERLTSIDINLNLNRQAKLLSGNALTKCLAGKAHPFSSTYAKFPKKLTFLTQYLFFWKILSAY